MPRHRYKHGALHVPAVQQGNHLLYQSFRRLALRGDAGGTVLLYRGDGRQLRTFKNTHALLRDVEVQRELRHAMSAGGLSRAVQKRDLLSLLLELRQVREHVLHVVQVHGSFAAREE